MISFTYLSVFACCLAYATAVEDERKEGLVPPPATEDVAQRELTDTGYVIRYGDALYRYPLRVIPIVREIQTQQRNPTETNEIESEEEDRRRPLFYFTYESSDSPQRTKLPDHRPYIEIRRKREATPVLPDTDTEQEPQKVNLRQKRTHCRKCGRGGYGGYVVPVPVTYAVYPVYNGGGGGGKGCYTCGGGGGGGGGGSFSYSSSSSHSSSGSFGWGKK